MFPSNHSAKYKEGNPKQKNGGDNSRIPHTKNVGLSASQSNNNSRISKQTTDQFSSTGRGRKQDANTKLVGGWMSGRSQDTWIPREVWPKMV